MLTIYARNVEEAWAIFLLKMRNKAFTDHYTTTRNARGRATQEITYPVSTLYSVPEECWLLDPERDANPFFHVYEALWILAGLNDVDRPAFYAKQIREYSDDGSTLNGAYGYRMRHYFGHDQLRQVIDLLRAEPDTRRAVVSLFDPKDITITTRDVPCNTTIYFKQLGGSLNMTVCNRSNDAVWGCYGANAVHFSFLLQYVAGTLGLSVGHYVQVSDSLHVYVDGESSKVWERCLAAPLRLRQSYFPEWKVSMPMLWYADPQALFDHEVAAFLRNDDGTPRLNYNYQMPFFRDVVAPMFDAYMMHREGRTREAMERLLALPKYGWLVASYQWLKRRLK